jgi:matrix metalloproteinase-14 (membrane-inserted)
MYMYSAASQYIIAVLFQMYLMKYGYMDDMDHSHSSGKSANLISQDGLKKYIMEFQAFAGLNQTGDLDTETVKMMKMPRCGVKDIVGTKHDTDEEHSRKKRYALQGKNNNCWTKTLPRSQDHIILVQF